MISRTSLDEVAIVPLYTTIDQNQTSSNAIQCNLIFFTELTYDNIQAIHH